MNPVLHLWLLGVPLALGLPFAAWLVYLKTDRADWIDVAWAFSLGGLAGLFAVMGSGDSAQRILVGLVGGLWGLRLGLHLAIRVSRDPHEDGRYRQLRADWSAQGKGRLETRFLTFFLMQGMLNLLLCLPFLFAASDPVPGIPAWAWAGALIAGLAVAGEGLADAQLRAFKADPLKRGQVCREGLWAWSRHPNYFFEWLVWVGFALMALGTAWSLLGLIAPALIFHFLTRLTGIPATEAQALRSKGEAYRRYQQTVSAFFPLPPKQQELS
jgi:steroid 5-alpha reductase family enzyme